MHLCSFPSWQPFRPAAPGTEDQSDIRVTKVFLPQIFQGNHLSTKQQGKDGRVRLSSDFPGSRLNPGSRRGEPFPTPRWHYTEQDTSKVSLWATVGALSLLSVISSAYNMTFLIKARSRMEVSQYTKGEGNRCGEVPGHLCVIMCPLEL